MTPIFSVLHATYGRPAKARAARDLFFSRARHPEDVQYILGINSDDPQRDEAMNLMGGPVDAMVGKFKGSAEAWNEAAKLAVGRIFIQGQDDIEPPVGWDQLLLEKIGDKGLELDAKFFIGVHDGYRNDALCCTAIMSKAYRDLEGHFLCPDYISVFSDDDVTYRALRRARDGEAYFISAREIVFRHRHHYHDKTVPNDATYERENSATAYAVGEKLFRERNPRAATDGLKTW